MMRRLTRFSLRSMLLVVTALCVFLGYELEWIRRRRAFVDVQITVAVASWMKMKDVNPDITAQDRTTMFTQWQGAGRNRAPFLLWLFREPGLVRVLVTVDNVNANNADWQYVSRSHPKLVQAHRLFPEAEIQPILVQENSIHYGVIRE